MTVTLFGFIVIAMGGWLLLRGTTIAMLMFVMATSLLSGAAAFAPSGLNGSTVPPAAAAMPFLFLRCLLPGGAQAGVIGQSLRANIWLLMFTLYGSITAYVLPKVFAGAIDVTPLRPIPGDNPFLTFPLGFSAQNITVSAYLLLTLTGGLCAYVAMRSPGSAQRFARMAAIIAIAHAVLGFASVVSPGTPLEAVLRFFRNGFYAQLDQTVQGFVRMNGIAPEPSGYALFGFSYFVLVTELWLRDVDVRWTRIGSLLLFCALLLSTSSTAYLGLGGYAVLGALRLAVQPDMLTSRKWLALIGCACIGLIGIVAGLLAFPTAADAIARVAQRILFDKADSLSGQQRLMWAQQGWKAFLVTGGLGVGMGSFRSSSILTAIIGSTGIIGVATFAGHLAAVLKPLRASTFKAPATIDQRIGVAASWTAVIMLVPAAATAASPDPGMTWGIIGGVALGLRRAFRVTDGATRLTTRHPDRLYNGLSRT